MNVKTLERRSEPGTELMKNAAAVEGEPYSDDQIVNMYISVCGHSERTRTSYRRAICRFRSFLPQIPLRDVTWKEVEAYKLALIGGMAGFTGKPLSPASVSALIAPLKSFYKWGSDENVGIFPRNPTTSIKLPQVAVTSRKNYLTNKEVGSLLHHLKKKSLRNYLIGLSLVTLGLRVSELVSMKWEHFHTDAMGTSIWLNVPRGKGGKSRDVKIPANLWSFFQQYRRGLPLSPDGSAEPLVFPITARQIERIIRHAGLRSIETKVPTPHWLRHTNATLALLRGATLQQVQENLGHTHLNTTQRYLHTVEQLGKAAPDFVEDFLMEYIGK